MHRFYADERGVVNGAAWLDEQDSRHALRVLRMKEGDALQLFAQGGRYGAVIDSINESGVCVSVMEEKPTTEAELRITLFQGLPKADKMELICQKAVELGAQKVVPVAMSRCVVTLSAKDGVKKRERWQKIARQASKQSGRCSMMQVEEPVTIKQMLNRFQEYDAVLVPWEDASGYGLKRFHSDKPQAGKIAIVIGPEGGMSAQEIDRMREAGATPVTLGPRILRTETAGLAAISALMCLWGEME